MPEPSCSPGPLGNPYDGGLSPDALSRLVSVEPADLIGRLHAVQDAYGYLPAEALAALSTHTGVPLARLYGVATFYEHFFLQPRGRTIVKVCHGTACHVVGAERVTDALATALGVAPGETTEDRSHTLSTAACLGCCSLAPVVAVGDRVHARVTPEVVHQLVLDGSDS